MAASAAEEKALGREYQLASTPVQVFARTSRKL
jgi:hypothetical protein